MAKNEVYRDADHLSLPVPSGTKSGDAVIVGSLPGIAQTDRDANGNASVWRKGAHSVPVAGAVTAVGQPIYIPTAGGGLTATVGTNVIWGYALATKGSGTGPLTVAIARV